MNNSSRGIDGDAKVLTKAAGCVAIKDLDHRCASVWDGEQYSVSYTAKQPLTKHICSVKLNDSSTLMTSPNYLFDIIVPSKGSYRELTKKISACNLTYDSQLPLFSIPPPSIHHHYGVLKNPYISGLNLFRKTSTFSEKLPLLAEEVPAFETCLSDKMQFISGVIDKYGIINDRARIELLGRTYLSLLNLKLFLQEIGVESFIRPVLKSKPFKLVILRNGVNNLLRGGLLLKRKQIKMDRSIDEFTLPTIIEGYDLIDNNTSINLFHIESFANNKICVNGSVINDSK